MVTSRLSGRKAQSWLSAAEVSGSQLFLSGSGYITLVVGGRTLNVAGFAALTSFYLMLNVAGRGLCSASELELTRSVAFAGHDAARVGAVCRAGAKHAGAMVGLAVLVVLAAAPLLDRAFGGDTVLVALLALSLPGMALSYLVRGPLAGKRRYHPYAVTFAVEAAVVLLSGLLMAAFQVSDVRWWAVGLVAGPLAGTLVAVVPLRGVARRALAAGSRVAVEQVGGRRTDTKARELVAAVIILGCTQAVWNLPPVLLTSRITDAPAIAAGFAAVTLVLRMPVLLFPAVQALLLPVLATRSHTDRVPRVRAGMLSAMVIGAVIWLVGATALTPLAVRLTFGGLTIPAPAVLTVLAAAALIGSGAQIAQTALVAHRRQGAAAAVWASAAIALVAFAEFMPATPMAAAGGLGVAVCVALAASLVALRATDQEGDALGLRSRGARRP